jgi:uncharacterized protein with FMN-binding domain
VTRLARALVALFVANALAVLVIWWIALDTRTFASPAGTLNALGRIAGLAGTYLILVQLILRTHVAWLVTAFGKDALKRWHTWNAYVAFGLLGAHAVLQTVGYALQDRVDLLSEIILLVEHYEGMLLAIAGLLLLAGLTVIALDRYRHRIVWPTWRALHLYTYVAVALSVPHQIATGSDFIDAPLAVAYWTGLLGVTVAILAFARVPPLWRAATATGGPHPAIVGVGTLVVAAYLLGTIRFTPAQATIATEAQSPRPTTRPSPAATAAPSGTAPLSSASVAIEGRPFDTPYGPAQVRLILTAGHIDDVEPVLLPSATKRSKTISASAEYWLRKRAIAAQSADFEILSGATYTSNAYQSSLESALHIAGLD